MEFEELLHKYNKQCSVLGGTRTALRVTREHRDRLKRRVEALEALLAVVNLDKTRFDELLRAINVVQQEIRGKSEE